MPHDSHCKRWLAAACLFAQLGPNVHVASVFVTLASPNNLPQSGYGVVTVFGLDFASQDPTATVAARSLACQTTSWSSSTVLTCILPADPASLSSAWPVVSLSSSVGTGTMPLSFDAPVASFSAANLPDSPDAPATVSGLNFGLSDTTVLAAIAAEPFLTSSWTSATSLAAVGGRIVTAAGQPVGSLAVVLVGGKRACFRRSRGAFHFGDRQRLVG